MSVLYEVTLLPEGRTFKFAGSRGNYYELADGSRLDLSSSPAWCGRCNEVVHAEELTDLSTIDARVAELFGRANAAKRTMIDGFPYVRTGDGRRYMEMLEEQIVEAQLRRAWRAARTAPAKCLQCGSTDILMPSHDRVMELPSGRGSIRLKGVGMCSTQFDERFFTPEGDRIPRDTKPTYWRHPSEPVTTEVDREMIERFRRTSVDRQHGREDRG